MRYNFLSIFLRWAIYDVRCTHDENLNENIYKKNTKSVFLFFNIFNPIRHDAMSDRNVRKNNGKMFN